MSHEVKLLFEKDFFYFYVIKYNDNVVAFFNAWYNNENIELTITSIYIGNLINYINIITTIINFLNINFISREYT